MRTCFDAPTSGRWRFLAVTATIAAAALMGACDSKDDTTTGASAPPTFATPKEALLAALPNKNTERFAFTITDTATSSSGSGVADPAAGAIQVSGTTDLAEETKMVWSQLVIGTDSWARIKVSAPEPMPGFTDLPDKWLHIDKTKIGNGWAPDPSDPAGVSAVLNLLTDVTESSPGKFTGTVDLSGAKDLYLVNEIEISLAGEHAKALPFEAEVDAKGRLASFTVKLPATGGDETDELKVTFSDFGSAPAITAPAASETQEAPESTYPLFS